MAIEQHKDVESGYLQEPFVQPEEVACKEVGSDESVENGSIGMVLLSTLVAVCGSFTFGNCVSILKHMNIMIASQSMLFCMFSVTKLWKVKIRKEKSEKLGIYGLRKKHSENTVHCMCLFSPFLC